MTMIYLVRHGRAAASWGEDLDPGLDDLGQSQAEGAARALSPREPTKLITSPLKRAQETSLPLSALLGKSVNIEPRVAEIPSPGLTLEERGPWLSGVMRDNWANLSDELQKWQREVVECLTEITEDTAVFSHFIAINAAVGAVAGDPRVINFRPDNASITILENDGNGLRLVKRGDEANTAVG